MEALEQHARSWGPNLVDEAQRMAETILTAAEMPTDPDTHTKTGMASYRGLVKLAVDRGHPVGGEVWYAAKVAERIADARRAMTSESQDQLLHDALQLGALLMEWEIQHHWGRGIDLFADRNTWAQQQNKERTERAARSRSRYQDMADAVWAKHPDWGKSLVAEHIARRWPGKLKANTIRRQIAKPQK